MAGPHHHYLWVRRNGVGPSGSGKSTIVSLIERFYDATQGAVLFGTSSLSARVCVHVWTCASPTQNVWGLMGVDGENVKDLDPRWYRKQIGLVNQEPVLFAASIADNICT